MDRPLRRPARGDSHLERRDDELRAHMAVHRPADDPAAEEILYSGQVQPALAGLDLLDVRRPHAVGRLGTKLTSDEVTEGLNALNAGRAALAAPAVSALHARQAHQPGDALLADPDAFATQHRVYPRGPVAALASGMNRADPLGQPRVGELAI